MPTLDERVAHVLGMQALQILRLEQTIEELQKQLAEAKAALPPQS